jgi:hypothetical protein
MSEEKKAYVVCCEPRVVLFGYADDVEIAKEHPTLSRCRMLIYWDAATKGVLGSAAHGPTTGCRVTAAVPEVHVRTKVEAVMLCSEEAVQKWESGPWAG